MIHALRHVRDFPTFSRYRCAVCGQSFRWKPGADATRAGVPDVDGCPGEGIGGLGIRDWKEPLPNPQSPIPNPRPPCPPLRIADADHFVTTTELIQDTNALASILPPGIDAVAGVARSGMIPAAQLAAMLHLPLYAVRLEWSHTTSGMVSVGSGWRFKDAPDGEPRKMLVVDDTASGGASMAKAVALAAAYFPDAEIVRAAIYSSSQGSQGLDYLAVRLDGPHYLQWNLFNGINVEGVAIDFDGVLCDDFPLADCDDGPRYAAALAARKPLHLPRRRPVDAIITARREQHRAATEAWLARWGVRLSQPGRLIMYAGHEDIAADPEKVSAWKAEQLKALQPGVRMMIESDPEQALAIAAASGVPVLCPALGRVIRPAKVLGIGQSVLIPNPQSPIPSSRDEQFRRLKICGQQCDDAQRAICAPPGCASALKTLWETGRCILEKWGG
jgi:adenine/guanine phosphoribosyltransferase-like PRPP-binding protein